jgi:hypothetical protein
LAIDLTCVPTFSEIFEEKNCLRTDGLSLYILWRQNGYKSGKVRPTDGLNAKKEIRTFKIIAFTVPTQER